MDNAHLYQAETGIEIEHPQRRPSWRIPKRFLIVLGVLVCISSVASYVVWSQTWRVQYLDINSGATKRTLEIFGIPLSSSPGLPPVFAEPGLTADWRRAGARRSGAVASGAYGRAAGDYRTINLVLDEWELDDSDRAAIFRVWREYLRQNLPGFIDYTYSSEDEHWPPVAARIENDDGEWVTIFDFRK